MVPSFETTLLVPMTCQSCIDDISTAVNRLDGIDSVSADLSTQTVHVKGRSAPSAIVAAIQATGRDGIVRGSGKPNGAAVSILETFAYSGPRAVRGLVRLVQVGKDHSVIDISLTGLSPGRYSVSIRTTGNLIRGPETTGSIWNHPTGSESTTADLTGDLGIVIVGQDGTAGAIIDRPFSIVDIIGRSVVVAPENQAGRADDPDSLVGVLARSAGVWENTKVVCSCSGKTVWEERKDVLNQGVL